eukprot:Amastigsp_a841108_37.p2 type:complete len:200 gc:universal Amastigsp_a841108_37:985-386(-)
MCTSTMLLTLDLSTVLTTSPRTTQSTDTLLPRPSIQFTAATFLSVHTLPESARTSNSTGATLESASRAFSVPLPTMFIPIASPDDAVKRRKTRRPAWKALIDWSFAKRDDDSKSALTCSKLRFMYSTRRRASATRLTRSTGARDMPSRDTTLAAPPERVMALHPLVVDAMSAPSVVAMGTWYTWPSIMRGPATPTGMGT